jgi:hypothetical protein
MNTTMTMVNMTDQMRAITSRRITELSQEMADEQRLADALRQCADEHDHRAMQARRTAERLVELLEANG